MTNAAYILTRISPPTEFSSKNIMFSSLSGHMKSALLDQSVFGHTIGPVLTNEM